MAKKSTATTPEYRFCKDCFTLITDKSVKFCPACGKNNFEKLKGIPPVTPAATTVVATTATAKTTAKKTPAKKSWISEDAAKFLLLLAKIILIGIVIILLAFAAKKYLFNGNGYNPGNYTNPPTSASNQTTAPNTNPNQTTAPVSQVANEQSYIPHTTMYESTGISGTKSWDLTVSDKEFGIAGGVSATIDGILYEDGAYIAVSPGPHKITVSNGFFLLVPKEWAPGEFDFRVNQAHKFGWLANTVKRGDIPTS